MSDEELIQKGTLRSGWITRRELDDAIKARRIFYNRQEK